MTFHPPLGHTASRAGTAGSLALALVLVLLILPYRPALAQGTTAATSSPEQSGSGLLRNADLGEGFQTVHGGHGSVAAGWLPWWIEGSEEHPARGQQRPPTFEIEARASSAGGVRSGAYAQRLSSSYATHEGGMAQRVVVAPGSVVRFAMWVRVWSSSSDDPARSFKPGDYRVSLGIDPTGGTDGASTAIVWSPELVQYDDWVKLSVSAVAQGHAITMFTRGACSWRVKHNVSVWDEATLDVVPPAMPLVATSVQPSLSGPANVAMATLASDGPGDAGQTNLLRNPDFEETFTDRGAGEVSVAIGWHPWWENGSAGEVAQGYLYRPEFKPERREVGRGRVHAMNAAQKQFSTYATHRAGIYQRVPVTPGSRITFSIWAYVWSSDEDDSHVSARPGDYRVSVGIDATGGTDGTSSSVVWSQPRHAYDRWVELSVTAVAQGPAITVFTRGDPVWRVKHNDSYWDDAALTVEPGSGPATFYAANATRGDALVPGRARVLAPETPGGQAAPSPALAPAAPAALGSAPPVVTPGRRPVGNVPDVARVPRSLGAEATLSYAGAHLTLAWRRSTDGVIIGVQAPERVEGELALWHQRQEIARWAISVVPGDPLTITWPGQGVDTGELGVHVSDSRGNVLARCGTGP